MVFLLVSFAGLTLILLVTLATAEAYSAIVRLSSWLRSRSRSRRLSLERVTFQSDSMRRYALRKEPSPLGRLRVSKSRFLDFETITNSSEKDE